jgi:cell division protein FtsN
VAVYTSPGSPLQPPVAVYTAPAPAPQAPAVAYSVQPSALIKPHLPDPAGSGVYRVQVGSYADPQNAQVVAECLVRAGLCPAYEQYGQVWRVVIPGVSAQQLTFVAQQLGALGINEAWIRQEG